MLTNKQHQEGGDHSTNIQANNVSIIQGVNLSEARQIALDVFEANFLRLTNEAAGIATKRVEEFIDKLVTVLIENAPEALESFNDPDMQHSLFAAQKGYARTGNQDHLEMLVNILVDRAKETEQTLKQLVLNEAVSVASKLTSSQYDMLAFLFIVKNTVTPEMYSLDKLIKDIEFMISLMPNVRKVRGSVLHLLYAGCLTIEEGEPITEIFRDRYPGLFYKGFTEKEFYSIFNFIEQGRQFGDEILCPCLHNPELWQPKPEILDRNNHRFTELIQEIDFDGDTILRIQKFFGSHSMSPTEMSVYLHQAIPEFHRLSGTWAFEKLSGLKLTSVGVAIAQANLQRKFNFKFDLAVWLS